MSKKCLSIFSQYTIAEENENNSNVTTKVSVVCDRPKAQETFRQIRALLVQKSTNNIKWLSIEQSRDNRIGFHITMSSSDTPVLQEIAMRVSSVTNSPIYLLDYSKSTIACFIDGLVMDTVTLPNFYLQHKESLSPDKIICRFFDLLENKYKDLATDLDFDINNLFPVEDKHP